MKFHNIYSLYCWNLNNYILSNGRFISPDRFLMNVAGLVHTYNIKRSNLLFFKNKTNFRLFTTNFYKLLYNYSFFSAYSGFNWYRFVLYSGLGYKRRLFCRFKIMFAYIGDRDWILYKFPKFSGVMPVRRRNYIFFSRSKGSFLNDYNFFSSLNRYPPLYKMKGFLDARIRGRFLFVRRIKVRGAHTKLSKKQKLL